MENKSILITGTHCTGKSTLLESLREDFPDYTLIGGVTREAKSYGLDINKDGSDETQLYCACSDTLNILRNRDNNVIYDRSIIDTFIYTLYLLKRGSISLETYYIIAEIFNRFKRGFTYILWVRPEFELVDDGVRDTDVKFQTDIDLLFEELFENSSFENLHILSGSVEEKVEQFKTILYEK